MLVKKCHGLKPLSVWLRMILWQQWLILQICPLKSYVLRLRVPGFQFSISILSGCFNLLFLSPSSPFNNTDSATYQEDRKCTKQGCPLMYVNKGHSEGRIFWCFSSFKSTHLKLVMLQDLECIKFYRVCFTISLWLLEGINNIKRQLFSETVSIHANN